MITETPKEHQEEVLTDEYIDKEFSSKEEFEKATFELYDLFCGQNGKDTFTSITFPKLLKVYRENYRNAATRALKIIRNAQEQKSEDIDSYLDTAITNGELRFMEKSPEQRREIVDGIEQGFDQLIQELLEEHEEDQQRVIAVVIYGSFAKDTFHRKSDVDIVAITEARTKTNDHEENNENQRDFDLSIQRFDFPVENLGMYSIEEIDKIIDNSEDMIDAFIVVSPDPKIKQQVEMELKHLLGNKE